MNDDTWPEALLPPLFYDSQEEYEMPDKINYKAMDDHELLVMAVMQGNDTVKQQEKIINRLDELNGNVKSDHNEIVENSTGLRYVRYMVYILAIGLVSAITTGVIGIW